MAWLKLDDQFFRNPKVIEAGRDARDLYLAGLCYCGAGLTDGKIPAGALRVLGAEADIDDAKAAAASLVRVGLWHQAEDGSFTVHDFLDYNPSKSRVTATREARAEAGSRGGKQKASNLLEAGKSGARNNSKQNATPSRTRPVPVLDPVPDPAAEEHEAPAAPLPVPKFSPVFEVFWKSYPGGHGNKVRTYAAWKHHGLDKAGAADERERVAEGLAAWKACERWAVRGMVKAAETWVKERWWEDQPPPADIPRAGPAHRGKNNDPGAMFDLAQQYERQGL